MRAAKAPENPEWHIDVADEAQLIAVADWLAGWLAAGDMLALRGELGAGKTTLARALVRQLTGDPALEVPSPTFTLMQTYEGKDFPIVHADLFRIQDPSELAEIGWEDADDGALVVVEWPERAGANLAEHRLDITLTGDSARGPEFRRITLFGHGRFAARLARARLFERLFADAGFAGATRIHMQGDASTRSFERLHGSDGRSAILMIMPPRPTAPIVRYGKPYGEIAKLAPDIRAFDAMDRGLVKLGLSAPKIYAMDVATGTAILEDLGSEPVTTPDGPIIERYQTALDVLAHLHTSELPATVPLADGGAYAIPAFDYQAMLIEVELLADWYAPHCAKIVLPASACAAFADAWRKVLSGHEAWPKTWALRDFHSPNLIWLKQRDGLARIGLVDFQDAVLTHPAYDVVSLAQDARLDVIDADEMKLLGHYALARRKADSAFDLDGFLRAYAILGAQRNTKLLGIFARLDKRDHKPAYLAHLPRIRHYLRKNLAHSALEPVRNWYESHLPTVLAEG